MQFSESLSSCWEMSTALRSLFALGYKKRLAIKICLSYQCVFTQGIVCISLSKAKRRQSSIRKAAWENWLFSGQVDWLQQLVWMTASKILTTMPGRCTESSIRVYICNARNVDVIPHWSHKKTKPKNQIIPRLTKRSQGSALPVYMLTNPWLIQVRQIKKYSISLNPNPSNNPQTLLPEKYTE